MVLFIFFLNILKIHLILDTLATLRNLLSSFYITKKFISPQYVYSVPLPSKVHLLEKQGKCKSSSLSLFLLSLYHNHMLQTVFLDKSVGPSYEVFVCFSLFVKACFCSHSHLVIFSFALCSVHSHFKFELIRKILQKHMFI